MSLHYKAVNKRQYKLFGFRTFTKAIEFGVIFPEPLFYVLSLGDNWKNFVGNLSLCVWFGFLTAGCFTIATTQIICLIAC